MRGYEGKKICGGKEEDRGKIIGSKYRKERTRGDGVTMKGRGDRRDR